jgi:hypothetical protein
MVIVGVIGAGAGELRAQETQVPVDSGGRIQLITPELAGRLGLFRDIDGFREARLFQLPDSTFVLEISTDRRGLFQRVRRPLSPADAAAFRRDVTSRVQTRARSATLDQGGRTKLLVGSTIFGLGYYGWATAMAFDPDNSQGAVAIYMLAGAGSFLVPFLMTRNRSVPDAVATTALWGATRGPVHGYLVSQLGDAGSDKTKFGWSVATGAFEAVGLGIAAQRLRLTAGRAELMGVGGDIGMGAGFAIADLLKFDERRRSITVTDPFGPPYTYTVNDRSLQSAAILAGSTLGLAGGYLLGRTGEWTRGDAMVFRNLVAMGSLAGLAGGDLVQQPRLLTEQIPGGPVYSYYEDGFSRVHSAGSLLGGAAGITVGRLLLKDRNFTTGQGTLLTLAPLAGGLIGLGIGYLATPEKQYDFVPGQAYRDPNDHSELYLTLSTLGAVAGFAAMYPPLARQAYAARPAGRFEFSINPLAAAHLLRGSPSQTMVASIRYRF